MDYCEGGYKDVDIENKIADIGNTRALFHRNLQVSKQCLAKIKQYSKFYQELIQIWANASKRNPPRHQKSVRKSYGTTK